MITRAVFLLIVCSGLVFAEEAEESDSLTDQDNNVQDVIDKLEAGVRIDDIVEPTAGYHYSSFSKKDPFSHPTVDEISDEEFASSKLQKFDVSSLQLVGIWKLSTGISRALVLTPHNEGIVVSVGSSIGQNNGEVLDIARRKIIVREYTITPDGTRQFNDIPMPLAKEKDETTTNDSNEPTPVAEEDVVSQLQKAIEATEGQMDTTNQEGN